MVQQAICEETQGHHPNILPLDSQEVHTVQSTPIICINSSISFSLSSSSLDGCMFEQQHILDTFIGLLFLSNVFCCDISSYLICDAGQVHLLLMIALSCLSLSDSLKWPPTNKFKLLKTIQFNASLVDIHCKLEIDPHLILSGPVLSVSLHLQRPDLLRVIDSKLSCPYIEFRY